MSPLEASGRSASPRSSSGRRRRSPCRSSARRRSQHAPGGSREALELSSRAGRAHRVGSAGRDLQRRRPLLRAAPSRSPGGGRRLLPTARNAPRRARRGHLPDLAPASARDQAPGPRQTRGGGSRVYLRAEQLSEQLGIGEPCVVPWAGRAVIAHARAGRDTDAARVLGWLDSCADAAPVSIPPGCRRIRPRRAGDATRGSPRLGAPLPRGARPPRGRRAADGAHVHAPVPTATCCARPVSRPRLGGSWPRRSTRPRARARPPLPATPARGCPRPEGGGADEHPTATSRPRSCGSPGWPRRAAVAGTSPNASRCRKPRSALTSSTSTPSSTSTRPGSS